VRDEIELEIAVALDAADFAGAAHATIAGYGREILGFINAVLRDEGAAHEVFAQFCEDLWRALPRFRREASVRTWAYKLARAALSHFARDPFRRRAETFESADYGALVVSVSSQLVKEQASARLEAARAALDGDDQQLLVLRFDRKLAWTEVADVMDVEASVLRKRFERIKHRLREVVLA
jgi:RNA polymerase sigma-70 factor (ECF subfamily)